MILTTLKILKNAFRITFLFLAGGAIFFLIDSGNLPGFPVPQSYMMSKVYCASDNKDYEVKIPSAMNFSGEGVPLENKAVKKKLGHEFLNNDYSQPSNVDLYSKFRDESRIIAPILSKNDVPRDFVFLCVAESRLQNDATSSFGASGMWQFMRSTGLKYGLEINSQVDERLNLERSTEAACAYLKEAHDRLGSWTLAAASYNMGIDALALAVKNQKTNDFYKLELNSETTQYLFRILAMKAILSHPEDYGMTEKLAIHSAENSHQTLTVDSTIHSLKNFARQQGTDIKTLKKLNPWMKGSMLVNKSGKNYHITIPTAAV